MGDKHVISIADYIHHLSKELEIEGAVGLGGNEMEIIAIIRNCPFLFDKSYPDFKDIEKKNQAWQAIAAVFNVSVSNIQHHWRNMREAYTRFTSKTNSDSNIKTYAAYFDEMKFLLPFIHRRNRSGGSISNSVLHLKEDSNTSASSEPDFTSTDYELKLEVLIDGVQRNPILYDRRHKDAKNHDLKLKTWKKVSKDLAIPVSECVSRWKTLRERYARERKYRRNNPEGKKWFLYEKLSFLEDHVLSRKRFSHTQMLNQKSKAMFHIESYMDPTSNSFTTEHQYCKTEAENPEHDIEYITVEELGAHSLLNDDQNNDEDNCLSTYTDDTYKDEDELFALAIAAELRKISSSRTKMKLKADIYKLLCARSCTVKFPDS